MLRGALLRLSGSDTARTVVTRTPLRAMSRRFVPGERAEDLIRALQQARRDGMTGTGNYLGEAVEEAAQARRAADAYVDLLERMAAAGLEGNVSLKFTQLGQAISEACLHENLDRVLAAAAATGAFIRFDMESSAYTTRTLDAFEALWAEGHRNIGVVLQAYLRRTAGDVARMNRLGARVRLCKGAYAEPEEVAFQDRDEVDRSFVDLMRQLLSGGSYPAIATHDDEMIEATLRYAAAEHIRPDAFEFQMLYGVRRDLQRQLVAQGWRVRVYVPFGEQWYPYLMRRLAERPANMLFLAGSVVRESPLGFLWPNGKRKRRKP
jgi:proline dehydrogenase